MRRDGLEPPGSDHHPAEGHHNERQTARPGQWHPLLNADENRPGFWTLRDSDGNAYGGIRITRQGAGVYYLAQYRGNPLGRFDRLRTAVENVHLAHVRATQHPRAPFDHGSMPRP